MGDFIVNKNNVISFICGAVIFSSVTAFAQETLRVESNKYPIFVNGENQNVDGYNINDYTYLKLSDFKKLLPVDISFDEKNERININTSSGNTTELKKRTDDGIEIHYIDGKGYINSFDLQYKFNCLVVGSSFEKKLKIYGEKLLPAWDLGIMKPLIETDSFLDDNNEWYFDVDYYEKTLKTLLNQPRENLEPSYTKDNVNIYVDNGIEYVLPSDISKVYFGEQYRFNYQTGNIFSVLDLGNSGDYSQGKAIISSIPSKALNGHLCIEYEFFKSKILPLIRK